MHSLSRKSDSFCISQAFRTFTVFCKSKTELGIIFHATIVCMLKKTDYRWSFASFIVIKLICYNIQERGGVEEDLVMGRNRKISVVRFRIGFGVDRFIPCILLWRSVEKLFLDIAYCSKLSKALKIKHHIIPKSRSICESVSTICKINIICAIRYSCIYLFIFSSRLPALKKKSAFLPGFKFSLRDRFHDRFSLYISKKSRINPKNIFKHFTTIHNDIIFVYINIFNFFTSYNKKCFRTLCNLPDVLNNFILWELLQETMSNSKNSLQSFWSCATLRYIF